MILSPLMFSIVLETLSKELSVYRVCSNDVCLMAETEEEWIERVKSRKDGMKLWLSMDKFKKTRVTGCQHVEIRH
jgi:hypothetical protein